MGLLIKNWEKEYEFKDKLVNYKVQFKAENPPEHN